MINFKIISNLSEQCVFSVQFISRTQSKEELTTIVMGTSISHPNHTSAIEAEPRVELVL